MVAGVGFTVAIFVATLAFEDGDVIDLAKLGIMLGSLVAAVGGYLILRVGGASDNSAEGR
jgi:NhaA family Na+:H+ antiporter